MAETIQYPYSKKSGFAALAVMLIFILLLGRTWALSYLVHDIPGMLIFGLFILVILSILGIMVYARLIPALKGEVALELDKDGVKDYIRNIILDWKDVEDIGLRPGRSSAMLIFELKFDSDFGKRVSVGLRWVEGSDKDIYDAVLAYFDEAEGIIRVEDTAEE